MLQDHFLKRFFLSCVLESSLFVFDEQFGHVVSISSSPSAKACSQAAGSAEPDAPETWPGHLLQLPWSQRSGKSASVFYLLCPWLPLR